MFDLNNKLELTVSVPIPSEVRTFCTVSGIDLNTYMCHLLSVGCIDHMLHNHNILLNFYNSSPIKFSNLFSD